MGRGHPGSRPEDDQPAQIKRMSNLSVQPRRSEIDRSLMAATQVEPYLPQPEQVEVIDQACANQQQHPAEEVQSIDRPESRLIFGEIGRASCRERMHSAGEAG